MKTKIIAILMTLVIGLSLCACGNTTTSGSTKPTDENGTLSAPDLSTSTKDDANENVGVPADLSKTHEVLKSFKNTSALSITDLMGGIMMNYAGYTESTLPTYAEVFDNMVDDVEYTYDAESGVIKVTGDLDVASIRTLLKFTCDLGDYDPFQGYDKLALDSNWYISRANSTTNIITYDGTCIAVADMYGEDGEYWYDMIIICSEMKAGHIDWDQAQCIIDEYIGATMYMDE